MGLHTSLRVGQAILLAALLGAEPAVAGPSSSDAPPFCMYSLEDGWSNEPQTEYIARKAAPDDRSGIPRVVQRIKNAVSIRAEFETYIAKADDKAFAAVAEGRRILVLNVDFLEEVNALAGTEWGAIQVVAHEVGHHIAGFSGGSHANELNADYWSGYILEKLGAARRASTRAILVIGAEVDTLSHPNKHRRARTIAAGWDDAAAGSVDYSRCDRCAP